MNMIVSRQFSLYQCVTSAVITCY